VGLSQRPTDEQDSCEQRHSVHPEPGRGIIGKQHHCDLSWDEHLGVGAGEGKGCARRWILNEASWA
jgi:hypothetical protein